MTAAKKTAGNALGLVAEARKFVERAMVRAQMALAEAEEDTCPPATIAKIARSLRHAMTDLEALPREIVAAVEMAAGPAPVPTDPLATNDAKTIAFAPAAAKVKARRAAERRDSP